VTDINVFQLCQPGTFADPLTEVLRNGARALLAQAVEAKVGALLSVHADKLTDDGHQRLVRRASARARDHDRHRPSHRAVSTVRDRVGEGPERVLPPYARRSKSLEVLIPILYLKGISTVTSRTR
jgi:putative transposase